MATPTNPTAQKQQLSFNGALATIGAAAGVGGLLILLFPQHRDWAIYAAIAVLLLGLGVLSML